MSTATRVYVVLDQTENRHRLIRAITRNAAERHAYQSRYVTRVATKDDLERLITDGVRVETANTPADNSDD